jgi:hypothetical protein
MYVKFDCAMGSMKITETSLSAIVAATFAAVVALIGLILAKEQKTSEFRQEWINALRNELATYMSQINLARDLASTPYESASEKIKSLSEAVTKLNFSAFSINLRLNSSEKFSQDVISSMTDFQTLFAATDQIDPDEIRPIETRFLVASKALLKSEWRRVKRGEFTYRVTRVVAIFVVLFGLAASIVYLGLVDIPGVELERSVNSSTK